MPDIDDIMERKEKLAINETKSFDLFLFDLQATSEPIPRYPPIKKLMRPSIWKGSKIFRGIKGKEKKNSLIALPNVRFDMKTIASIIFKNIFSVR